MALKYFENSYEDYSGGDSLLHNNSIKRNHKISKGLNEKWQNTDSKLRHLDLNDNSVYTGTSGVALLKLKKDPNNKDNLREVKNLLPLHRLKNRSLTFLCGDSGPLAIRTVVCHKLGNTEEVEDLVIRLKLLDKDVMNIHSDLPNEYMYGRAGYLFSILFVNKHVSPPPFNDKFIRQIIEAILESGKNMSREGRFKFPLMYQWHDTYYLGAAHGLSGILYLLLQARQYLTEEDLNILVKPTIDYLLKKRFPSGNFPSSLGRDVDKYVQWCHGAPGFIYLFSTAYKVFHDPSYLEVALKCGDVIWERGLVRKGYSLCHGVSGNAYCFLELFQTTKEEKQLYRAIKFADWCFDYTREHEEHSPDRPLSLYEDSYNDDKVQWCHGAPGFLYLSSTAYKVFQDPSYLEVALKCGEVIWERGLLRKGYSICHGVSGHAYCFLQLFQTTEEEKHLYRATKFAEWCLDYTKDHEEHSPDRPLSLFEGIAGPMYLLLDIQMPYEAKFPGFTL
ncbi:hypothetical protein JTB14_020110 [Gonioctena quinquepunctata]|nr:hypothetical protein JTB14_020110 [Gonioctena quinquepunctata]